MNSLFCLFGLISLAVATFALASPYGQLKTVGAHITNSAGTPVQLRGLSLFTSHYIPDYWNATSVNQIKCGWNSNVVRAPLGISSSCCGGWVETRDREYKRMKTVIDAAIDNGIYVIVDWHAFSAQLDLAKGFFANISKTYGSYPHIIYEIWNEPNGVNWTTVKAYAEEVIAVIRQNDPSNIIVVGTPTWSQRVDQAADNPINKTNIAYALHYYAATHKQSLRDKALYAINKGLPIIITEYGTVNSSGGGPVDQASSNDWWTFNDQYKLSYVNWAVYANAGDAAIVLPGTKFDQLADPTKFAPSGVVVNQKYQATNQGVTCSGRK